MGFAVGVNKVLPSSLSSTSRRFLSVRLQVDPGSVHFPNKFKPTVHKLKQKSHRSQHVGALALQLDVWCFGV